MIAQTARENLTKLAAAYAKATGTTMVQVSKKFYGNQGFFEGLNAKNPKDRVSVSIDKFDEMVEKFREKWPETAEWPLLNAMVIPRKR